MDNKPAKQEKVELLLKEKEELPLKEKEDLLLKEVAPLDPVFLRWLARDFEMIEGFTPEKPRAMKPPDRYIEFMRLYGWLDVDLDDPDLAPLFN